MKLHWSPKSPFVRKVVVCAHELGLHDRIECVRTVAALRVPNPVLMADNPLSKIPTLVLPDGRTLMDSAVICEYLDAMAGGGLFPAPGPARWTALRWQALADGLLDLLLLWRNERERTHAEPAVLEAYARKAEATLALLERECGQLAREPLTIGQLALGCALGYLDYRFADYGWRQRAPALARWHAVLMARPAFVRTEPVEG